MDSNIKSALLAHSQLKKVVHDSNKIYKIAYDENRLIFGAKTNLKRCNKVLRRLLNAVKEAESAEKAIKYRIQQTISCREETFSAVQIGDVHILVSENQLAAFHLDDFSTLAGELLQMESDMRHLNMIAKEVEESVNSNRQVLLNVSKSSDNLRVSTDASDRFSERTFSWFSIDDSSVSKKSFIDERELWRYKKKRYKWQRNISIAFAVISLMGVVALAILYYNG